MFEIRDLEVFVGSLNEEFGGEFFHLIKVRPQLKLSYFIKYGNTTFNQSRLDIGRNWSCMFGYIAPHLTVDCVLIRLIGLHIIEVYLKNIYKYPLQVAIDIDEIRTEFTSITQIKDDDHLYGSRWTINDPCYFKFSKDSNSVACYLYVDNNCKISQFLQEIDLLIMNRIII